MTKNKRNLKFLIILVALLAIQLIPSDKTAEKTIDSESFFQNAEVPDNIKNSIKNACADCHSNLTKYPWYASVQPFAWWIEGHVGHAREKLNFSKWNSFSDKRKSRKIDECIEMMEKNWMPPISYKMMHKESKLSDADIQALINYFKSIQ